MKTTRKKDWVDIDLDFIAHPTTGDIVKKTGPEAVKRSIRNLVLTNFYEKKFRHGIGSSVQKMLFENINPMTATFLKNAVVEVITNFEPRAELYEDISRGVVVKEDIDGQGYIVTISFKMRNSGAPVVVDLFLERVR